MGKPYAAELGKLADTYSWAIKADVRGLGQAIRRVADSPLIAVGSGGSLTVAEFAAGLHRDVCGSMASAQTPLEAVASGIHLGRAAVLMTTAGGSNPDVLGSFERLAAREPGKHLVLCLNTRSPLARLAAKFPSVGFFGFDAPAGADGFLATNSLIASIVLLTRAYADACNLPVDLPPSWRQLLSSTTAAAMDRTFEAAWQRETLVVLHGPSTKPAAIDLESKFTEAALRNVWTADFRHFAHGRHHWLAKRASSTAVLAFVTPDDEALATRTLALIPSQVPTVRENLAFSGVRASVAALARVLYITGSAGRAVGIDPGRPGVPPFGRKIYHLRAFSGSAPRKRMAEASEEAAIQRKARRPISTLASSGRLDLWRRGYRTFLSGIRAAKFRGVVLDYDGTLCGDESRFGPMRADVANELIRLLRSDLVVGIATGRGKSVKERLREAIPEVHWQRVLVGYYNGGDIGLLSDDGKPDGRDEVAEPLQPIAHSLARHALLKRFTDLEFRPPQVKVEIKDGADAEWIWGILQQVVHSVAVPGVSLLRSSHSVDVLAPGVDKRAVVRQLTRLLGDRDAQVLCIGDKGLYPGNDFLLLDFPNAISVDEVSSDPATCWNLAPTGVRSADACLGYLRRLGASRGVGRFK